MQHQSIADSYKFKLREAPSYRLLSACKKLPSSSIWDFYNSWANLSLPFSYGGDPVLSLSFYAAHLLFGVFCVREKNEYVQTYYYTGDIPTMVAEFQVVESAVLGCQLVPPVSFFSPGWHQWRSLQRSSNNIQILYWVCILTDTKLNIIWMCLLLRCAITNSQIWGGKKQTNKSKATETKHAGTNSLHYFVSRCLYCNCL